jgi:RHS repeat-associated protein
MRYRMKLAFVFLTALFFLQVVSCFAKPENFPNAVPGPFAGPGTAIAFTLKDDQFGTSLFNSIVYRSVIGDVSLRVDDTKPITHDFTYKVKVKLTCYGITGPAVDIFADLQVTYTTAGGATYQGISSYQFSNYYKVDVTIMTEGVINPATDQRPEAGAVKLSGNLTVDRTFPFTQSAPILFNTSTIDQTRNLLLLSWGISGPAALGAEEYDLEWTTLSAGDINGTIAANMIATPGTVSAAQAASVFRNNASRITLTRTNDTIALSFNDDYLVVRIRQVQYQSPGIRLLGDWNYKLANGSNYAAWNIAGQWHASTMNWQYSASYAEDGKKNELISYFDGTLRNRQMVTINNTDQVPVIVETVYDLFGRAAVSILPTPVKEPLAGFPYLHYFSNLNRRANTNLPYDYTDLGGNTDCEATPGALNTSSGSGKYYSPGNDFINDKDFNKYIPDAEGYPLSVTQYMADNTGRVKLQGGVGLAFQPGQSNPSHTTKYIYGKPEQWELDQLFGNEAGYAEHYSKNTVIDPNNQISVGYLNASGKTVATALAGGTPVGMDSLTSKTAKKLKTTTLLRPDQFIFDNTGLNLKGTTSYVVTSTGPDTIRYDMQKLVYTYAMSNQNICSNCYYDLSIRIVNACTPGLYTDTLSVPVGVESAPDLCTTYPVYANMIPLNFTALGEYYITFEFKLNKNVLERYVDRFVALGQQKGIINTEMSFIQPYLNSLDFSAIIGDCRKAKALLGTKAAFTQMMATKLLANDVNMAAFNHQDSLDYSTWVSNKYDALLSQTAGACDFSPCQEKEESMLKDVSPGGQYALFDQDGVPLETGANVIKDNWRAAFPVLPATDPLYIANSFTTENGKIISANDANTGLPDIVKYWKPEWAQYFLMFHPELCQLEFCYNNSASKNWDEQVKQTINKASEIPNIPHTAGTPAYNYNNGAWLLPFDAWFTTGAGSPYYGRMLAQLNNYTQNVPHQPAKSLTQFIDQTLYCNGAWGSCDFATCRVPDRDWNTYKKMYFELKDKFYTLLKDSTTCANSCTIGTPFTPHNPANTCATPDEFSIRGIDISDPAAVGFTTDTLYRPVLITYERQVLKTNAWLYFSVPQAYASSVAYKMAYPTSAQSIVLAIPKAMPVSTLGIKMVNCTNIDPAPYTPVQPSATNTTIQRPTATTYSYPAGYSDFYISSLTYNYHDAVSNSDGILVVVRVKPGIKICTRPSMSAIVNIRTSPANSFNVNIGSSSYSATAFLVYPPANTGGEQPAISGGTQYTPFVSGRVTACSLPLPANNGCNAAYAVKISRFEHATGTIAYPTDSLTAVNTNKSELKAGIKSNCEINADSCMAALADGLAGKPQATIDSLKARLIRFCANNGDETHPFGASTFKGFGTNPDAPLTSFGDIIKTTLGIANFTPTMNPWLLNGPNPYNVGLQYTDKYISTSNQKIVDTLAKFVQAKTVSGFSGTLYQYLSTTYGAAMTLTSGELDTLNAASASCNFVLKKDLKLPVFMQPGVRGCVSYAEYQAAIADLQSKIPTLTGGSTKYDIILTNFMNQRFGFTLSYSDYTDYQLNHTGLLCNTPPNTPFIDDPYAGLLGGITVAVVTGKNQYADYIAVQRNQFRQNYISTCSAAQSHVTNSAFTQIYHYTLYYYDQADNLIRTIPPEGVVVLSDAQVAQVQQIRAGGDAAGCTTAFTGPSVAEDPNVAFGKVGTMVTTGTNGAIEFWLYNTDNNGNQLSKVTADGKYQFQLNIRNGTLGFDIYYNPAFGSFANINRVTVSLSNVPALQLWTHVVVQASNFLTGELSVYVNGVKAPVVANPLPQAFPENLLRIKHLRVFNHLLLPAEVMLNAANNCFMPVNPDAYWARFNLPAPGSETTVGDNTSIKETKLSGIYPTHLLPTSYVYNATNQVIQQNSPDGGTSSFWYDTKSRLIASQNAKQAPGKYFSYTEYDDLGRIQEVGQKKINISGLPADDYVNISAAADFVNARSGNEQMVNTYYDDVKAISIVGLPTAPLQTNLRKRVAASTYTQTYNGPILQGTYYNYDLDGNVKTLYQRINGLDLKQIEYEYDLISGKVNFVKYQAVDGAKDKFFYKYRYDAENRITEAWSGTAAILSPFGKSEILPGNAKKDAHYFYYLHGPLARVELGGAESPVQGMDYAYTLQGWIKGVNNQTSGAADDIGKDGASGNHQNIPKDAFAYSLGYYTDDYKPIGGTGSTAFSLKYTHDPTSEPTGQDLFNGNISNSTMSIGQLNSGATVGYTYHYDQLNRLKTMYQHLNIIGSTWNKAKITPNYAERYTYDGNGNILTLNRHGASPTAQTIDSLKYNYTKNISGKILHNKLGYITDYIASSLYTGDLVSQSSGNYTYDAIGNLTKDTKAYLNNVDWTVYGKIQKISKTYGGDVLYNYDVNANRVSKVAEGTTTWYVRDAQGNALALYDNAGGTINWREQNLYGSSRLGIWSPNLNIGTNGTLSEDGEYGVAGRKFYELNNHLGNVMATISDRRVQKAPATTPQSYLPDVISAQDYYAFGMLQPGRQFTASGASAYRYGFNGKENDNEVKKDATASHANIIGAQQDYGMRIYDPRLGRFLSTDPLSSSYPWYTPYQFAGNKPIRFVDLDGMEEFDPMSGENTDMRYSGIHNAITNTFLRVFPRIDKSLVKKELAALGITDENVINKFQMRMRFVPVGYPYDKLDNVMNEYVQVQDYERVWVLEPKKPFLKESLEALFDGAIVYSLFVTSKVKPSNAAPQILFARGGNLYIARNFKAIFEKLTKVASKYSELFTCKECAADLVKTLKKEGVSGEILDIKTNGNKGMALNIWSDSANAVISFNGTHRGVLVEGKVFDNLHPNGIGYEEWLKDLRSPTGYKVDKTPF